MPITWPIFLLSSGVISLISIDHLPFETAYYFDAPSFQINSSFALQSEAITAKFEMLDIMLSHCSTSKSEARQ